VRCNFVFYVHHCEVSDATLANVFFSFLSLITIYEMLQISKCLVISWDMLKQNLEFYCTCLVTVDINILRAIIIILSHIRSIDTYYVC
jgi:hypothetical protein